VLESGKSEKEKDLAEAAKTQHSLGAPDCPVSQRSAAQSARDAWPSQRSDGGIGQCLVRQRLQIFNGRLRQIRKAISTGQ
jgi:hypothetical protein